MAASHPLRIAEALVSARFERDQRVAAVYLFGSAARSDQELTLLMATECDRLVDVDFSLSTQLHVEGASNLPVGVGPLNTADAVRCTTNGRRRA